MNYIYHEKQEGSLCGQHCLNNLLQGQFFTAVELAEIAQQMDQEEQRHMAELGTHTADFKHFLEQPSSNMDDSGMFSVQVLTSALKIWDLTLVPYASSSPLAVTARANPVDQQAYICNFKEHWFTVRKLGRQWFNLNSLLTFPELISDLYLACFLIQLQHEGYAIFVLDGELPPCEADDALKIYPAVQTIKPQLLSEVNEAQKAKEEQELKAALRASLDKAGLNQGAAASSSSSFPKESSQSNSFDGEDEDLRVAMLLSLQQNSIDSSESGENESDELQKSIKLSLEAEGTDSSCKKPVSPGVGVDEARELEKALQMSLDSALCEVRVPENPLQPDLEEIRRKRLEKLDKK